MVCVAFFEYLVFLTFWVSIFTYHIWSSVTVYLLINSKYYFVILIYTFWLIVDRQTANKGGRLSRWFRNHPLWSCLNKFFPVIVHKTSDLNPNHSYIFGCHPHGMFTYGTAATFYLNSTQFEKLCPGITVRVIMHSMGFWLPLFRDIFLLTGICSSDKESIEYILSKLGNGNGAAITIGGVREAFDTNPHKMRLTLKSRKGFVKIAIKYGASLVPCICFDQNALFADSECKYKHLFKTLRRWSRNGLAMEFLCAILFKSLWPICNWRKMMKNFNPFETNRKPMHTIIGNPIQVDKNENPTDEEINKYHQLYIRSLSDLFYSNREQYATNKHIQLIID